MRVTLPKQDRSDTDSFVRCVVDGFVGCEVELAKVIENARDGEDVESTEGAFLLRISRTPRRNAPGRTGPVPWGSSWLP
jgi:hypothetical protein